MRLFRRLLREYASSLGVDLCFQGFDRELAGLPGDFAPPSGGAWLAWHGDRAIGCVALRRIDGRRSEMKRLYVRPRERGHRMGAHLAEVVVRAARARGYRWVYLDTLPTMRAARSLYARMGFVPTRPYRYNPVRGCAYLRLPLRSARGRIGNR